eukprot:1225978-Prymnesium_polylepis.1
METRVPRRNRSVVAASMIDRTLEHGTSRCVRSESRRCVWLGARRWVRASPRRGTWVSRAVRPVGQVDVRSLSK